MARNTSAEATLRDNEEWLDAHGGLRLADALAIHNAIHDSTPSVTLSTGECLPITVSANGCRRCDV